MKPIIIVASTTRTMRYATCGDWQDKGWGWLITIVKLRDWRYGVLIAVHELVEMACCKAHGVTERSVDAFDLAWTGEGEPGDADEAPYRREHVFATRVEQMLAVELGVNWTTYEAAIAQVGL